jgi:hypothetical protein
VTPPPGQTPVLESDVIGLISDLGLRPVQGPGFGVGRTALINSVGAIETVIGNLGDCVHVDGTSGPCSDPTQIPTFIDSESPGGIVDGTNMSFSLASTPVPASGLSLYRNGLFQKTGFDYTLTGSNVQFMAGATPQPGDTIVASYRVDGTGSLSLGGLTTSPPAIATVGFAQVICSSTGTSTSSVTQASLGSCTAPANLFKPGDRIEVRFDFTHQGTSSGFDFRVRWGGTMMVQRTAQPGDAVTAGRGEAAIGANRSQLSIQSWGTLLGLLSGLVNATDSLTAPLKIDFLANLTLTGSDSVTLLNYTVLRYPAISHP